MSFFRPLLTRNFPVLISIHKVFYLIFSPSPAEKGEWESSSVGTWQPAKVIPPQRLLRETLKVLREFNQNPMDFDVHQIWFLLAIRETSEFVIAAWTCLTTSLVALFKL